MQLGEVMTVAVVFFAIITFVKVLSAHFLRSRIIKAGHFDKAEILDQEQDKFIRFKWLHSEKNEYFEFRVEKTEISNQTVLIIKDFAEKNEIKDQSQLWGYQVKDLFHRIGS